MVQGQVFWTEEGGGGGGVKIFLFNFLKVFNFKIVLCVRRKIMPPLIFDRKWQWNW